MKKRTSFKVGRDAATGRFISLSRARRRPETTVVEKMPIQRVRRVASRRRVTRA
jgi:hypothetical protein